MKKVITLALCATLFSPVLFANESSSDAPPKKEVRSEKNHSKKDHDGKEHHKDREGKQPPKGHDDKKMPPKPNDE